MAIATSTDFLAVYPEFGYLATSRIDSMLVLVEDVYCPASVWDDPIRQKQGVMLRTAHTFDVQRQQMAISAAMGAATSTGQPPSLPTVSEELEQTTYGRQFKELRRTLPSSTGFAF